MTFFFEDEPQTAIQSQNNKFFFEDEKEKKPKESIGKSALRTGYQPISGYLKKFTWPADVAQLLGGGEALDPEFIEHLKGIHEREGIPFDEHEYKKQVGNALKYFPTQSNIERGIEEKTGLPLEPKNKLQKALNLGGTAAGFTPGSLTRKGIAGATAPLISEIAQGVGIPEQLAEIAGLTAGGGVGTGKIAERLMTSEQQALRRIAEKHNLPTYAGMESEGIPKVTPIVSKQKHEKLSKELSEASENAINKVISEELPLHKAEKLGVNAEDVYTRSYQRMEDTAKKIDEQISKGKKKPINFRPVLSWIKKEIAKIKKSAPSLSTPDKARLKILNEEYTALTVKPKLVSGKAVKLVDMHGKPIAHTPKGREPKEINASQAIDQTRNYNENVRELYKKSEFTGAQNEVRETYAKLNDQIDNAINLSGEKDLSRQLHFGNQVFHEVSKTNHVRNILKPALENGYNANKMASILKNKSNRKFLERNLGKQAIKDLVDIAHYGQKAEKLVFERLKNPKTVGEIVSNLTPLKAGILFLKHGATAGLGTAYEIGKGTAQRIAGTLFTRPGTRKAYKNFVEGAQSTKKGIFAKASEALTKAIVEEFGSEENLMKLSTDKEE